MSKHTSRKPEASAAPAPEAAKPESKKSKCPISRADFDAHAKPVEVTIGGSPLAAMAKAFSTGSLGWYAQGKIVVSVNGVPCNVQVGLNMTIVGSKELPQ